jgi:hypothetical protein
MSTQIKIIAACILLLAIVVGLLIAMHFERVSHKAEVPQPASAGVWQYTPSKPVAVPNPFPNANN